MTQPAARSVAHDARVSRLAGHVAADLDWIIEYWPDLLEQRLPGTTRPWRQPELTPEQRAERDHAARLERLERTGLAWGETPAPLDVEILDLLVDIVMAADDAAGTVATAIMCPRLAPPSSAFVDPLPWLDFVSRHLPDAPLEAEQLAGIARAARRMVDATARALCLVYDGQRLDVICPWCEGRTEAAPVGGERTWRVRQLPGDLVAIVCEGGACEPPSKDVGTWWLGRPCWPVAEWDWLAQQVTAKAGPVRVVPVPRPAYGLLSGRA